MVKLQSIYGSLMLHHFATSRRVLRSGSKKNLCLKTNMQNIWWSFFCGSMLNFDFVFHYRWALFLQNQNLCDVKTMEMNRKIKIRIKIKDIFILFTKKGVTIFSQNWIEVKCTTSGFCKAGEETSHYLRPMFRMLLNKSVWSSLRIVWKKMQDIALLETW